MFTLRLDHVAVLGETLAEAVGHVERALGQPMAPGGVHARFGTHNQLLGLEPELYIEAIAIDPSAPDLPDARWFGLDTFRGPPRLDKWICAVDNMEAALRALPMAGRPVELSRGTLSWTMAVPESGLLPFDGLFPALIQWHAPVPPGKTLAAQDAALMGLTVSHPQAHDLQALLAPHMDAPLIRFAKGAPALSARIQQRRADITLQ